VEANHLVIQPNLGKVVDRVKLKADNLAFPISWYLERAAVESDAFIILFDQLPCAGNIYLSLCTLCRENFVQMPPGAAAGVFVIK
jgi:hypothetical protein